MTSENPSSADNQQERFIFVGWIVGFTDGEGCFSVSIFRNKTNTLGWQVMPEFVLTQGASSVESLQKVQEYFGCGKLFLNTRYDNHHEHLYRYCVRRREDLETKIVPFFQTYQLQTAKRKSFDRFVTVLQMLRQKQHLTQEGLEEIARLVGKQLV